MKLLTRVTKNYRTVFTGLVFLTVVNCATVVKLTVNMCKERNCKENEQINL